MEEDIDSGVEEGVRKKNDIKEGHVPASPLSSYTTRPFPPVAGVASGLAASWRRTRIRKRRVPASHTLLTSFVVTTIIATTIIVTIIIVITISV